VLHQIGVGALGPVFRTYEPTRDRLVAVKVFRLDVTPEQARSLADELARAAEAGLFHPSIVEPVAAGLQGTVAYRAEEYVAAESLDVAMRHYAPATLDKVLPFITQLASALDFARAAGVGHGALHPRDIFVTPDEARATGFGVVDALDRLGLRAPVRRPYSPPERIAGQAWSTQADVFSLAVVAFELLTGRRPSGVGDQMGPLTGATLGARGDAIRTVLIRAMQENPADRYSTAMAFASALDRAAGQPDSSLRDASAMQAGAKAGAAEPRVPILEAPEVLPSAAAQAPIDFVIRDPEPTSDVGLENSASERHVEKAATDAERQEQDQVDARMVVTGTEGAQAHALDDFAAEAAAPGPEPGDSPREVARKVIAAREVRKRQIKRRSETADTVPADAAAEEESTDASWQLSPEEPAVVASIGPPGAASLFDGATDKLATTATNEALAEAPEFASEPIALDTQHRVVAVDEFRAREAAGAAAERGRPRVSERVKVPKTTPESLDAELPLPAFEESPSDRPRVVMLPIAVVLILGLVLGYAAGYVVGSREQQAAQTAPQVSPAPTGTPQTPGTTGKAYSEQAVSPTAGQPSATPPAVPSDTLPVAPAAAPPAAARSRSGRVVVSSSPTGASVTVNGVWSGRTPLTLNDLAFREYVIRLVHPGYEVAREAFTLSRSAATRTISVKLRREATSGRAPTATAPAPQSTPKVASTGAIYVDSRPRGARVIIDGKEHGTTPLQVSQSVGSHVIRLELADHEPWTITTQVTAGKTARVAGSLERIR